MQAQSIDKLLKKSLPFFFLIGMLTIWFFEWRTSNRINKKYIDKCKAEKELEFNGIVTNYLSNVLEERGSFNLNDTGKFYTIPRSSKAMYLIEGDTIIKLKNRNRYIVKRHEFGINSLIKKAIDTFDFDCPGK